MSDQISTRTWTPYLAVVLSACWTGATPAEHTVQRTQENSVQRQVHGKLERRGNHIAVGDVVTVEEANDLWLWADGHEITAELRIDDNNVSIESVVAAGDVPYVSIGPIQVMNGTRVLARGEPGSKLADSMQDYFDAGGIRYGVIGGAMPEPGKAVSARVRVLEANMAHHARSTSSDVWFEQD